MRLSLIALRHAHLRATLAEREAEIRSLRRELEQARRHAHTDPLTGLPNRRHFMEQADRELARADRYGRPFSILVIDLDHFKSYNDRHGHAVGDAVLVAAARAIATTVRKPDVAARLGGEEFVVLAPNTDARQARVLAERLRRSVASAPVAPGVPRLTTSIGVGTWVSGDPAIASVLERADRALYRAKGAGRNCVKLAGE